MTEAALCWCGVLAVGRCVDCSRAFCASDQAQDWQNRPITNLCPPCQAARTSAEAQSRAAREQARADALSAAYERIRLAARRLAASGPSATPRRQLDGYKKVRFGRYKTLYRELEPAWPVGTYTWTAVETQWHGDRVEEPTGVTRHGDIVQMSRDCGNRLAPDDYTGRPPLVDRLNQIGATLEKLANGSV